MPLHAKLLYATSARIGGSGLDSVAFETLLGAHEAGILKKAIAFDNRQRAIPASLIRTLRAHPVRLLSFLERPYYYGAKKHWLDWIASREIAGRADYNLFHGWSGECVRTLRAAADRGIPTLIEIPTWHRNKGKIKPSKTKSERVRDAERGVRGWMNSLLVSRQQVLEEYDLATLILVLSEKAAETFLAAGIPEKKLFRHSRGVDVQRFTPAEKPPEIFRAIFVGALIRRKGVHRLLEVWHRLNLKNAELVLVGSVHDEMKPALRDFGRGVRVAGFSANPQDFYREASVHIFPSTCEGSAKATYEAAACGLPQITTRESGDVVLNGVNGLIVPPDDSDALAAAIERLYRDPDLRARMGAAGRARVLEQFTWAHFRHRLLAAYRRALSS